MKKPFTYGLALIFLLAITYNAWIPLQAEFEKIIVSYGIAFGCYLVLVSGKQQLSLRILIGLALAARLTVLPAIPNLSDDIFRFYWDGQLWWAGENPFDHLPSWYAATGFPEGLDRALFLELNSPDYHSIYPPVCQFFFALTAKLSGPNIALFSFLLHLAFLIADILVIFLIYKTLSLFGRNGENVLLYALNPLVILELFHNLHFELIAGLFVIAFFYMAIKGKWAASGIALALAVATKLNPLIALPLVLSRWDWRKYGVFLIVTFVALAVAFMPLFNSTFAENIGQSLDLYFRKFEFNASIYYLVRWVTGGIYGYNLIASTGPVLAALALFSLIALWLSDLKREDWLSFTRTFSWAFLIYLALSTTVHPWYLGLLVLFLPFTRLRSVIAWSFLIMLSYHAYASVPVEERAVWLWIEYGLLGLFVIWDFKRLK